MAENKTRYNINRDQINSQPHVDSGYEGDDTSDDFSIPPVGLEDADIALFKLFDRDLGFTQKVVEAANKKTQIKKPFVIFATGERFALAKRMMPPRDRNKKILLPAISIRRTGVEQTADDITGRGMNQFSGNIMIKRRLNEQDKDYQNLINKFGFKHLQGLPDLPESDRRQGDVKNKEEIKEGGLLTNNFGRNIWEVISVPQPQFFTSTYEVTFWTSYVQHMNYMIETFMSSFLPNDRIHKLVTDKGYWFIAYTEESFQNAGNMDDFQKEERLIRYTINMKVKGYIFAPQHPTNRVPVRRWISSPEIHFDFQEGDPNYISNTDYINDPINTGIDKENQFALADIERDPEQKQQPTFNDQVAFEKVLTDPITGKKRIKTVKPVERNEKQGETVFRASDFETLEEAIQELSHKST